MGKPKSRKPERGGYPPALVSPQRAPELDKMRAAKALDFGPEPTELEEKVVRIKMRSSDLWLIGRILEDRLKEDEHLKGDLKTAARIYNWARHFNRLLKRGE